MPFDALQDLPPEMLVVIAGALLSSLVAGAVGFGDALVASAVWLHVLEPSQATPLVVGTGALMHIIPLYLLRRSINPRRLAPFLAGGLMGVPVGVWALTQVSGEPLRAAVGLFLVVYGIYGLARPSVPRLAWAGWPADGAVGLASGVLGGLAGLSGILPTIWSEFRGWTPAERRGVYQAFIFAMHVSALALLLSRGAVQDGFGGRLIWCLPALALGSWLGMTLFRRLDPVRFRQGVLALLLVSGVALLV
ncbi:MAG: sulfite exporter TauE/SafE family protein [Hyphomicrobiales bacterium]|nr:sulfite exporter TauE/SafE family protein [Hyphomicrobiales bacterium]